jgi:hypothetical protein
MTDLRPLPIYPPPSPEQLAAIRAAKAALGVEFLVTVVPVVAGTPSRVLAFSEPPYICDHYLVTNDLPRALRWTLTGVDDPRATLLTDTLRRLLPRGVTEVFDD